MTRRPAKSAGHTAPQFARFFKTTVGFDDTLRQQFPTLYRYLTDLLIAGNRERAITALKAAVDMAVPTVAQLLEATRGQRLRKSHRDAFRVSMLAMYDQHFPRAGGRTPDPLTAHTAFLEKQRGATWRTISTSGGTSHAEEDRSRKIVGRDQTTLTEACLYLIGKCGPDSQAPADVKAEFQRLQRAARAKQP